MSEVAQNSTAPNRKIGHVGAAKIYVTDTTL